MKEIKMPEGMVTKINTYDQSVVEYLQKVQQSVQLQRDTYIQNLVEGFMLAQEDINDTDHIKVEGDKIVVYTKKEFEKLTSNDNESDSEDNKEEVRS